MKLIFKLCLLHCLSLRMESSAQIPFVQQSSGAVPVYPQETPSPQNPNGQANNGQTQNAGSWQNPPPPLDQIPLETRSHVPMTDNNICLPNPLNPSAIQVSVPDNCGETTKTALSAGHPDQNLDTGQILAKYSYPYQKHDVVTADGYILTLFRITGSPYFQGNPNAKKPSILLQHGLFSASDNWLIQPLNRNLPMKLADAGFDVWLGNSRGTTYSRGHIKFNHETDLGYWDFSWHEMAMFDVPAMVDYIRNVGQNQKIFWVGHSMGTMTAFAALSEIPDLNEKIEACFMLAPVAYIGHQNNLVILAFPFLNTDAKFQLANAAFRGVFPTNNQLMALARVSPADICSRSVAKCGLCDNFFYLAFGYNPTQMDPDTLPSILQKFPNTASVKTLAHFGQINADCTFKQYDYGVMGNWIKYNSPTPPHYRMDYIRVPMYLFYGDNDNLVPPNDVFTTASKFAPGILKLLQRVPQDLFTHANFLSGRDADILVYNQMLDIMNQIMEKGRYK